MEEAPGFEQRERAIDELIAQMEKREGMTADAMLVDILAYAPYEGNARVNLAYLAEIAEMLGISEGEMHQYAKKKAGDHPELRGQ